MVVITGGEPAQLDPTTMLMLVTAIRATGRIVDIESSGQGGGLDLVWKLARVTLSPKKHLPPPSTDDLQRAHVLKLVVSGKEDLDWVLRLAQSRDGLGKVTYVQPVWGRRAAVEAATWMCMKEPHRLRLSLQTHKYAGLR